MMIRSTWTILGGAPAVFANTSTISLPAFIPLGAAALDPAPVGISYEFFTFPSYRTNVTATSQCEENLKDLSGTWPPIRIGGTTQDRAKFDPNLPAYVSYSVPNSTEAPEDLTYGPSFLTLAGAYPGRVVVGLNRGRNNLTNTVEAAKAATAEIPNLLAIELGNEPEYYTSDGQPIAANGTWNATTDAQSQAEWQIVVGQALKKTFIIEASNSLQSPPTWGAEELIETQNKTAISYIKDFSHHNYPGGTVESLMSHVNIVDNVAEYSEDVEAARNIGREYVFGETNSATGGGAASVSPSFGASLWVADYSLRSASANISRLYFHHGTIGACQYCWWGRSAMASPYYGAYFAAAALGGAAYIAPLDAGTTNHSAYAVFGADAVPKRVALFNTDYYNGTGDRGSREFVLQGLTGRDVKAKRLTAESASSRVDQGENPTFGGQTFANVTCVIQGKEVFETVSVSGGAASFTLAASEALLVYL